MECQKTRKKLKEFAAGEINDPLERSSMEAHINECPVCKKELFLWQDVIDKQKKIQGMKAGGTFRERVDKRMKSARNEMSLPPLARKFRALSMMWTGHRSKLLLQAILLVVMFIFLYITLQRGTSIIVPILIVTGFGSLFMLMLKSKK